MGQVFQHFPGTTNSLPTKGKACSWQGEMQGDFGNGGQIIALRSLTKSKEQKTFGRAKREKKRPQRKRQEQCERAETEPVETK